MRILLDECLPVEMRREFPQHDCVTVQYLKAKGVKDAALLQLTVAEHIDVLITVDTNMAHQQNFKRYPHLAVIFLKARSNDIDDLRLLVPQIQLCLRRLRPGQHIHIA